VCWKGSPSGKRRRAAEDVVELFRERDAGEERGE
jgi:hypothetical protein